MIILTVRGKAFKKFQHLFMTNTLSKLGIWEQIPSLDKNFTKNFQTASYLMIIEHVSSKIQTRQICYSI